MPPPVLRSPYADAQDILESVLDSRNERLTTKSRVSLVLVGLVMLSAACKSGQKSATPHLTPILDYLNVLILFDVCS